MYETIPFKMTWFNKRFSTLPAAEVAVKSLNPQEFIELYYLFRAWHEFRSHFIFSDYF